MEKGTGLRHNAGKTRHDLVPAFAQEQYARVLTFGALKYEERNWEKGMPWSKVLASLERHLQAVKNGEDFDPETGLLHSAHIMCNAAFLTQYFKTYPQGDDRPHGYLTQAKIGLDIDEVLADFVGAFLQHHGTDRDAPVYWNDHDFVERFDEVKDNYKFWVHKIKPKIHPDAIPFEPCCYITSRPIPESWTREWLRNHGFPHAPIYTVGHNHSKVEVAKQSGIDIFVDDRYENFVELNNAGVCTYLFDAPHNARYQVGYKRIQSLNQLINQSI